GQAAEELPEEENIESSATKKERHRQGQERVHPAQAGKHHKLGHHYHKVRQHHGGQHDTKPKISAGKFDPGKAISAKGGGQENGDLVERGNEHRIFKIDMKR